jgi:hypothetical protein
MLTLMASENRAAAALARTYPGGTEAFVAAMNAEANRLGLHAPRNATTRLAIARHRLTPSQHPSPPVPEPAATERGRDCRELLLRLTGIDITLCPVCHQPALIRQALPATRSRAPPEAA